MGDVIKVKFEEQVVPGKRLGRHIEHDERSRNFSVTALFAVPVPLVETLHKRHGRPFDQGDLGSCTGNATAGAINTEPLYRKHRRTLLGERNAVQIYELATQLDGFPGTYPPDDTGSSGLAAAQAAQQKGYIGSYRHAFSTDDALQALMLGPVITGVSWYEGFDNPNAEGLVSIAGQVRGGHEFEALGYHPNATDPMEAVIEAVNSWGLGYGKAGHFFFTVRTWDQLLQQQGDVTALVP